MTNFEQSKKITEGLRQSFRSADSKVANRACYGYITLPNGELAINEVEAATVRWIIARYIAGDSFGKMQLAWKSKASSPQLARQNGTVRLSQSYCQMRNMLAQFCGKRQ